MKVFKPWLDNFFSAPLSSAEEVANALTFHAFEIDGIENNVLDVKVTPNRGHDALSHRGIARELSAILNIPMKAEVDPLGSGFKERFANAPKTDVVAVSFEDPALSPRYIAGYIKNVKVGPSPDWLKGSLEAIGQRSINNVVDATNLVMFNTGQPLHAFDAGRLTQKEGKFHIVVRKAREGEKIVALDAKEYTLANSMLVIADGNADAPVGIAGIKGGTPAGISESTKDIIIESANFNSVSVRKAAQALKLRTDASSRFEQGISPELAAYGMQNAVKMIQAIAGGEFIGYADVYPTPVAVTPVAVSVSKINQVLGTKLSENDVSDAFTRLGFVFQQSGGDFTVTPPFERLDIVIPEDLIEEVGRIIGYDQVPPVPLSPMSGTPEENTDFRISESIREQMTALGYSEVFTSVFADRGERAVLNKVDSVRPYMRATLVDGLNDALKKNIPNKDLLGLKEIKLFEIGTVWLKDKEVMMVGMVSEKEKAVEEPLSQHKDQTAGQKLPLSNATRYQTFSKYPYIVRDVAFWTPAGADLEVIEKDIQKEAGELCVKIAIFDQFQKGEKTSFAFRLVFQSFERTLTEAEVNPIMEKVYASLKAKGFEIR